MSNDTNTKSDAPFYVRVTDSTESMIFLTDRDGEPYDVHRCARKQNNPMGLTSADIKAIAENHKKCFSHQEAYLVYDKKTKDLRIMVELEIYQEHLPGAHPKKMDTKNSSAWRATLQSYAPLFHYIGSNFRRLDEDTTGIETIFDFGGNNYGSICVLLPLERTARYTDTYLLLFDNRIPHPPSNHTQIATMGVLRWAIDEGVDIPAEVLPNNSLQGS